MPGQVDRWVVNMLRSGKSSCRRRIKAAIVGGGISGLSSAYFLLANAEERGIDIDLTIFESTNELGGAIRTVCYEGAVLELGPECFVSTKPAVMEIARDLLFDSRILAQAQRQTFIVENSDFCEIPEGLLSMNPKIPAFLKSSLFSCRAKMRMAVEPFIGRRAEVHDESVADFLKRRFGAEFLERLAEPLIGGLYGTDLSQLSAKSTMPHLVGLESTHGSVVLGMLKDRLRQTIERNRAQTLAKSNAGTMSTFDKGMGVLVEELKSCLKGRVRIVNSRVAGLWREESSDRWLIRTSDQIEESCDVVVMAVPAPVASKLLSSVDESLSSYLSSIKYSSPTVMSLIYDPSCFARPLKGSGFLVPKRLRRSVRACTFSSNKFKRETAANRVVLRVSCNAADSASTADDLSESVGAELRKYLHITGDPLFTVLTRHESAIPQFAPGHQHLLGLIERRKTLLPNFALVGNAYGGMGVSDCVMRAKQESERIAASLSSLAVV